MNTITTKTVTSVSDYTSAISRIAGSSHAPLWFRGCGLQSYRLTPTIYRIRNINTILSEVSAVNKFRNKSIPYITSSADTWLSLLFLMQHYGAPTRLLDWTESALVALYFAVENPHRAATQPAAVWVLSPSEWNYISLDKLEGSHNILPLDSTFLKGFLVTQDTDSLTWEFPVAIHGPHNSPRIAAQKGVFTLFGSSNKCMKEIYRTRPYIRNTLRCVLIPRTSVLNIRSQMRVLGFTNSVLFPELAGVAKDIEFEMRGN